MATIFHVFIEKVPKSYSFLQHLKMNSFQIDLVKSYLDKLIKLHVCEIFRDPVDEKQYPDYHDIIKTPMCLSQVQRKLKSRKYETLQDLQNDIKLIWSNAIKYNSENSPVGQLAKYLDELFNKKLSNIPENETEKFLLQLKKTTKKLQMTFHDLEIEMVKL